jgi:predicted kinase
MRPATFKTGRIEIPDYFGGTFLDVKAIGEPYGAYEYVMTPEGIRHVLPDGATGLRLVGGELTHEAEKAIFLKVGTTPIGRMTILSGPSGSGKSTVAFKHIQDNGHAVRINRDDIRRMTIPRWAASKEKFIIEAEKAIVRAAREQGRDVIIDDTNLTPGHRQMWLDYAEELCFRKAEVKFIDTPIADCIARDAMRFEGRQVGRPVIERQYLLSGRLDLSGRPAVVCDLDGTLFNLDHRKHLVSGICAPCYGTGKALDDPGAMPCGICQGTGKAKKDHYKFLQECINDEPVEIILNWLHSLSALGFMIILVSGRDMNCCGRETLASLDKHMVPFDHLFMRKEPAHITDVEVKATILEQMLACKAEIAFAIDDRLCVVQMWREHGVRVIPVRCSDTDLE